MAKKTNIRDAVRALKALASEPRLKILLYLQKKKTAPVGNIAKDLNMSLEATSHHLRILRLVDIVKPTRRGRYVAYRLVLKQEDLVKSVLREF